MQNFKKRYIILTVILSIFASVVLWVQYEKSDRKINVDISHIPLSIGEWIGEDISVDKETKDILETEGVLIRKYTNPEGKHLFLSIVYYKDSRVAFHLPEGCMIGEGTKLAEKSLQKIEIRGGNSFYANQLKTTSNRGNTLVLYYFETGNLRTDSYLVLRWQMMKNKLTAKRNSGALVKFSTPIEYNFDESVNLLKQFISQIDPVLSKYLT